MSLATRIARNEIVGLARSRSTWIATALFAIVVLVMWVPWMGSPHLRTDDRPLLLAIGEVELWLPLFAVALGTLAISGSTSRRTDDRNGSFLEITLGALLGRGAVLGIASTVVVGLLAALVVGQLGTIRPTSLFGGLAAAILLGLAWLSPTVIASRICTTRRRALALLLGLYVSFRLLWQTTVVAFVSFVLTGRTTPDLEEPFLLASLEEPTWYLYVSRLNPFDAFSGALYYVPRAIEPLFGGSTTLPHLPNLFGLGTLLAWAVVPVAVVFLWQSRDRGA
ncbi:ABC transporter permease subunit [Natrarchaeobius chitinivorans]|uniref:Copper ABC transporter permease n=1 Tax=Natrarchaeobius chitinivorans TaxID=1679083 RepID=A0A3N6NFN8_NATCH|nr:ABC transporter permease subunit [Natrarchaeobius chitinivorans]RQG97792.1 copper ABC transporter permease [Natrarchaeobius chitinivorans]